MKFGFLLPTCLTSAERINLAKRSYASLLQTQVPLDDAPIEIHAVWREDKSLQMLTPLHDQEKFILRPWPQPIYIGGVDQAICWCMEKIIEADKLTHVILIADDMVYHQEWYLETKEIIARHPNALAWSTYRSAHTCHHRTISRDGSDHMVSSLAGNGTCWSIEEWKAWGIKSSDGQSWPVPAEAGGGNTIDLHHAWKRPGERWVTDKSYMEHLGTTGVHCQPGVPEFALNFVGE